MIVGPTVSLYETHGLHVRADAGTGALWAGPGPGTYSLVSDSLSGTLELGAEVGYQRPLGSGRRVEVALAFAAIWSSADEEGDHGYYTYRSRIVTTALVVSFVTGR